MGSVAVRADSQLYVKRDQNCVLVLILSVHVDVLKLSGIDAKIKQALRTRDHHLDQLKLELDNFEHLGLRNTLRSDGNRTISQTHYVSELKPIPDKDLKLQDPKTPVAQKVHDRFRSLIGAVAWIVQTMPDIVVFVSALQRKMKEPVALEVLNLNRL